MFFGRSPSGRALRYNLFVCSKQKGFPLQSLTLGNTNIIRYFTANF